MVKLFKDRANFEAEKKIYDWLDGRIISSIDVVPTMPHSYFRPSKHCMLVK